MLRIHLLGPMAVECGGEQLAMPPARRAFSLLAHLALSPGPQPRAELAARFWPDVLDSSARASLRSAVWSLRRALGPGAERHLLVDRDHIGLVRGPELWVDAICFQELTQAGRMQEAVELCRGELLAGFEEDWALRARDEHRERYLQALECLAAQCEAAGDWSGAIDWSRRQADADPLGEEAHCRLIKRLAASGDRGRALVTYRVLSERLRRELSVAPSALTRALVAGLREEAAETDGPASAAPNAPPLIGRARELARLLDVWRSVRGRRGAVASLSGEAGIGKTRLASELLHEVARRGALTGSCAALDLGGAAPFGLWAELIRNLAPALEPPPVQAAWPDDLARLVPEIGGWFGRPPSERPYVSPDLERTRLLEAVVAAVEWAARERPLVLLLEDMHIADASSLELIGYVARRIASLPVMLLLTRRPLPPRVEVDRLEHALRSRGLLREELLLGTLAERSIAELAGATAKLSEPEIARVVAVAEGNPLLAVETARALSRGERELSAGVRGAVRGAFASLGGDGRAFVELASVAARELEHIEILALPIAAPSDAAVMALQSGMLVSRERRVGFRHALLRAAVYADLPEPRRATLHECWAQTLLVCGREGGVRRPAEVARHLRLAGNDRDAVEQLALAAEDARAIGALAEATGYLQEAVSMASKHAGLLLELAEVQAWRGMRPAAEAAFEQARRLLADDAPELARAWLRCARWYHGPICVPTMVRHCCREALALLKWSEETVGERREALAALAWAEAVAGSVQEAERLLAEVHELNAGEPSEDLSTYDVGHARALAMMRRGDFVAAYAPALAAGEAITRAGRADLAYGCWANAAGAATAAGDFERASQFLDRGAESLAGRGLGGLEVHLLAMRSFVLLRVGRVADARVAADAEAALAERLDSPELLGMAAHDRGLVALAEGDFEVAGALLEQALAQAAPISRPLTRLARAEALARAGRLAQAAGEVREMVLEPVRSSDFPAALVARLARVQGLIAAAGGNRELALERLTEAVEGWRRQVSTLTRGESMAVVLADLGRPVVGLIEPERELQRVQAELDTLQPSQEGASIAVLS